MNKTDIVFLIEDDLQYLDMYQEILNPEYKTLAFTSPIEALTKFNEYKPKTIILDLNLPEMSGIDFCHQLFSKHCSSTDVDIIFASGESDSDIKISAFDAGAADFLIKPFEIRELLFKVKSSVSRRSVENNLISEINDSKELIYTTMAQASQYSQVMNFFKRLSSCRTEGDVAQVFFSTMDYFGLTSTIRFKIPADSYFRHDGLAISPIEQEIYTLLDDKGRIFEFSNRIILNDKHVSFIIKNPPRDEHGMGQLRDYTAAIIEGLDSKICEIYAQSAMEKAISNLSTNIYELNNGVGEHNKVINSVMSNMIMEIAGSFHLLEMTEAQEVFLNNLIEKGTEQLSEAETFLVDIMTRLETVKNEMELVQAAIRPEEFEESESNDVELF